MCDSNSMSILDELLSRDHSSISSHSSECCERARLWFEAMAFSASLLGPTPPTWIRERWSWGPTNWPVHWCDLGGTTQLDCGGLAALSLRAIQLCGVIALPIQLIERFSQSTVANWRSVWQGIQVAPWWDNELVYHEAVLVKSDDVFRAWDPTDNRWIDLNQVSEYGIVALRVLDPLGKFRDQEIECQGHAIPIGVWVTPDGKLLNPVAIEHAQA